MSIESKIEELIAALNANTAAHGGAASGGKAADDKATTGRGRGAGKASDKKNDEKKFSADDVRAAAVKLKEEKGSPAAKALIKKHGADALADLDESVYAAFIADVEKALKEEDSNDEGDGL